MTTTSPVSVASVLKNLGRSAIPVPPTVNPRGILADTVDEGAAVGHHLRTRGVLTATLSAEPPTHDAAHQFDELFRPVVRKERALKGGDRE